MPGAYAVVIEGLKDLISAKGISDKIELAAQQAINKAADRGRTRAAAAIRLQVNFPASYLSPSGGRLTVSQRASKGHLEAHIRGRGQATSLARFLVGAPKGRQGLRVQVKPGAAKFLPRAFLIKLNQGASRTDTKFNQGLAVRLKPTDTLKNKIKAIRLANGLFLLYGPSIDQVFTTVREDITPEVLDFLESEFQRLVDLSHA